MRLKYADKFIVYTMIFSAQYNKQKFVLFLRNKPEMESPNYSQFNDENYYFKIFFPFM